MANELEQRAMELWDQSRNSKGRSPDDWVWCGEQYQCVLDAIVAALQQAQQPGGMTLVTREDGNNYCRILRALGMEEEGDPVVEVERLVALSEQPGAQAVAWMHEDDPDRVIAARMKAAALRDGGASASSVAPYTIALRAGAAPPPLPEGVSEALSDVDFTEDEANEVMDYVLEHGPRLIPTEAYQQMRHVLIEAARLAAKGGV